MKKVELLSGAGDLDTLKTAIRCGADAVYVSYKDYGARKYAKNFTLEELEEATKYCHLYGAKIYVTVNTLIHDNELKGVLDTVSKLYEIGVDALIMQDVGLIHQVLEMFPNMEIHVSTQAHNCSKECLDYWETTNVKRVVLARELSIEEISKIKTPLELEVFIHGALCVSYSGQCLISSKMLNRSGNRGECAQICRFCFDMYKGKEKQNTTNNYLLSMKDLCSADQIKELLEAGVSSLKIEGRMKSKYYVGTVTKFYRKLIDKYYNNEPLEYTSDDYKELLIAYNREFTKGFLGNAKDVVNSKTCNHQGLVIGEVLEVGKKIKIQLNEKLHQEDGIRLPNGEGMICNFIYNKKGLLINSAEQGDIVYIDNKTNLNKKGLVYKTSSFEINKNIDDIRDKKIKVDIKCQAIIGKPFTVTFICDDDIITKQGDIVEASNNSPVAKEEIINKLSKLGNTPFIINNIEIINDDNIFIPIKTINTIRRNLTTELIKIRENKKYNTPQTDKSIKTKSNPVTNEISVLARTESQIKHLLTKKVNIYIEDYNLYKKYKKENVFYRKARASSDQNLCDNALITNNGFIIDNYKKSVTDIYMNAYNALTVGVYSNYAYKVGLSPELNNQDIKGLIEDYKLRFGNKPNVEVLVYGKLELMIMKYCPVLGQSSNEQCNLCINNKYYLDDRNNHRFALLKDSYHRTRIMDYEIVDKINDINYLKSIGVTNYRIDLLEENEDEIDNILSKI